MNTGHSVEWHVRSTSTYFQTDAYKVNNSLCDSYCIKMSSSYIVRNMKMLVLPEKYCKRLVVFKFIQFCIALSSTINILMVDDTKFQLGQENLIFFRIFDFFNQNIIFRE